MSRHTRDRSYNFGGFKADLARGLETLDESTRYALKLGYKDIWVSREENPKLLEYFKMSLPYLGHSTREYTPRRTAMDPMIGITGHTRGFRKTYLSAREKQGHKVIGFSTTNGYNFPNDIDEIFQTPT